MRAYNVYLIGHYLWGGGEGFTKQLIDVVFYGPGLSAAAIKRQMVARGEYPANIYVSRRRRS